MQQYFSNKKENNTLFLNNEDYNHIKNVMRMKPSEEVFVVLKNKRYLCSMNEDLKSVTIKEEIQTKLKNNEIVLYVPFLQDEKMSLIFQKGTELGVTKFIVVDFEHSKYKLDNEHKQKKLERWNKIIVEASEQSYRNDIPVLENFVAVKEIKGVKGMNIVCSLDTSCVKMISEVLNRDKLCDKISIVFGPEGGISKSEEDIIVSHGFERVSLGKSVLRTETAGLYVVSIIKYLEGCE
jgi:16S rRNA (uracil1498-N3)-methyltransferase